MASRVLAAGSKLKPIKGPIEGTLTHAVDSLHTKFSTIVHPANGKTQKVDEVVDLFCASLYPVFSIGETCFRELCRIALKNPAADSSVKLLWSFLHFFTAAQYMTSGPFSKPMKLENVSQILHWLRSRKHLFPSTWKTQLALIAASKLKKGIMLRRKATQPQTMEEMGKKVFPLDRHENIVFSSCADSLVFTYIRSQAPDGAQPVLLVPGIMFYPHSSIVFYCQSRGIEVMGYEIDAEEYEINISMLTEKIKTENRKNRILFALLPSVHGRRVSNSPQVCAALRSLGVKSLELCVPTVETYREKAPIGASRLDTPDAFLVSFKSITCLDCCIGVLRDTETARQCQTLIDSSTDPNLGSMWRSLISQAMRSLVSNRVSFGVAVYSIVLLSKTAARIRAEEPKDSTDAAYEKVHQAFGTEDPTKKQIRNNTDENWDGESQGKVHGLQLTNLLLTFSKKYKESVFDEQVSLIWNFLSELPSYINVFSIGSCTEPLVTTEVQTSGLIIKASKPDSLVSLIRKAGFEGVHLLPVDGSGNAPNFLLDKVISQKGTRVAEEESKHFVYAPFHASVSNQQRKELAAALRSAPKELYGGRTERKYSSDETRYILNSSSIRHLGATVTAHM